MSVLQLCVIVYHMVCGDVIYSTSGASIRHRSQTECYKRDDSKY